MLLVVVVVALIVSAGPPDCRGTGLFRERSRRQEKGHCRWRYHGKSAAALQEFSAFSDGVCFIRDVIHGLSPCTIALAYAREPVHVR